MITPVRIRLSRAKGFDLQAASRAINGLPARRCCRPGPFGNPWSVCRHRDGWHVTGPGASGVMHDTAAGAAQGAVNLFRYWLDGYVDMPDLRQRRARLLRLLPTLAGHNLKKP